MPPTYQVTGCPAPPPACCCPPATSRTPARTGIGGVAPTAGQLLRWSPRRLPPGVGRPAFPGGSLRVHRILRAALLENPEEDVQRCVVPAPRRRFGIGQAA